MRRISGWIVAALVALALVETFWLRALEPLDQRLHDALLRRHAAARAPDPEIVRISIDERSLAAMAPEFGRHPWPRSVHAQLIEALHRHGARAVVLDLLFADPELGREADDAFLAEVAATADRAYFAFVRLEHADDRLGLRLAEHGERLGFERGPAADPEARAALVLPLRAIAETGRIGAINTALDGDGVLRRYRLHLDTGGWRLPSLPVRVAAALGYDIPAGSHVEIHWRGRPADRRRISYSDLFFGLEGDAPQRHADAVRGKVLVVGADAAALGDLHVTPVSGEHPGADVLAAAIETLKHGDGLRRLPEWSGAALAVAAVAIAAGLFRLGLSPLASAAVLLAVTPAAAAASFALLARNWAVPAFTPLAFAWLTYLAGLLREYLRERTARREAVRTFSRFVDPRVVAGLVAQGGDPRRLRGQSRTITVLFSDIRGFTTLSESREPQQVVELLNRYFSRQVEVIFRHRGTVDKFIGDAIMAFWGAPADDAHHADNAVRAALEMGRVVDEFRRELPEGLAGEFDIGIGVHTGPAVVGFIGSENKLEYTAIGDTVNLASRIEGATKGVARVLVSDATRAACGGTFAFADRGPFRAKGKSAEVRLFEPREAAGA